MIRFAVLTADQLAWEAEELEKCGFWCARAPEVQITCGGVAGGRGGGGGGGGSEILLTPHLSRTHPSGSWPQD